MNTMLNSYHTLTIVKRNMKKINYELSKLVDHMYKMLLVFMLGFTLYGFAIEIF